MLTAGQRCYSGPAAGRALADRVSLSNASHAPAAGGAATAAGQRHPVTPSPRHLLGAEAPGTALAPGRQGKG